MNSPMTELDHHFYVCGVCDKDKNIKKGLIALEDVREFEAKRKGITNHIRKFVSHGICKDCKDEALQTIHDYTPKK